MKTVKIGLLSLCALLVGACSNDTLNIDDQQAKLIRLEAIYPSHSRVTDTNFENQDKIGMYMTEAGKDLQLGGNEFNNEQFVFDGSVWNSRKLYWNKGKHDVFAYYPFTEKVNGIENFTFTLALDQDHDNYRGGMSGYEASDFLWACNKGVEASVAPIKMVFNHCMSKVNIKLVKGEDYEGEIPTDLEVFVHNTVPVASIDLASGGVSKDDFSGAESIKARKLSNELFVACVVPQQITSRRPLVEVVTQGVSYLLEGKISFKQGVQHTITVTLSKNPDQTKIEIGGEIENWN